MTPMAALLWGRLPGSRGRLERLSTAMGHASIKTTYDLYGHLDAGDVAADHALIEAEA